MHDIVIAISGMSCGHCLSAVNKAVQSVDGIELKSVRIGQAELRATDEGAIARVKAAIQDAGYGVEGVISG
jgi:copper chaperone